MTNTHLKWDRFNRRRNKSKIDNKQEKNIKKTILTMIILAFIGISLPVGAKRKAPEEVEPIEHNGIRFTVDHFAHGKKKVVEAVDMESDKKIWEVLVYTDFIDPRLERDVQDVFIVSLKVEGDFLLVTNEKDEVYKINLIDQKVSPSEIYVSEAYHCTVDSDCINTCAQGAVNQKWYEKTKNLLAICEDGCANKMTGPPQCIDNFCTAFTRDKENAPDCTIHKIHFK